MSALVEAAVERAAPQHEIGPLFHHDVRLGHVRVNEAGLLVGVVFHLDASPLEQVVGERLGRVLRRPRVGGAGRQRRGGDAELLRLLGRADFQHRAGEAVRRRGDRGERQFAGRQHPDRGSGYGRAAAGTGRRGHRRRGLQRQDPAADERALDDVAILAAKRRSFARVENVRGDLAEVVRDHRRLLDAGHEQLRRLFRDGHELVAVCAVALGLEHAREHVEEARREHARERVRFRRERVGRRRRRQRLRIAVEEGVDRVAQAVAIDGVGVFRANRRAQLFGEPRQPRVAVQHALRVGQHTLAERLDLERRQDGAHVPERLVERRGFDCLRVEQLRAQCIEDRVAHLVADDVRALAGKERPRADGCVEEVQAWRITEPAARVERVQVHPVVEDDRQDLADFP